MTETARPQTLEPQTAPLRNEGIPETSIAGQQHTWPPSAPWERKDSGKAISEREGEAQKSKPTIAGTEQSTSQTTASPSPAPKKKSKLRPRKAPINLTPAAVSQLHELADAPESKLIRVGVKNRGCSGLAYHLEYVDKAGSFDETVEQEGVKVLIDSKALFSIIGSEMDWVEDKLQARFVFRNPNISEYITLLKSPVVGAKDKADEKCSGTMWVWGIIQHIIAYTIQHRYPVERSSVSFMIHFQKAIFSDHLNQPLAHSLPFHFAFNQNTPGTKSTTRTFSINPSKLRPNSRCAGSFSR